MVFRPAQSILTFPHNTTLALDPFPLDLVQWVHFVSSLHRAQLLKTSASARSPSQTVVRHPRRAFCRGHFTALISIKLHREADDAKTFVRTRLLTPHCNRCWFATKLRASATRIFSYRLRPPAQVCETNLRASVQCLPQPPRSPE